VYNLGRVQEEQGKLNDADIQYRKALDIWAKSPAFGDENIAYAKGINRLGVLRIKAGDAHNSDDAFSKALKIDKRYGAKMARLEEDLNDMSAGLVAQEKFEKGLRMATKSLELKMRKLNNDDISLVPNYINMARANIGLNQGEEAQKCFNRAAQLLGAENATVSIAGLRNLSALYGTKVKDVRAIYEVPNFDTRGDVTYLGDGRI
jgi:tetratricopeptide (TPR) repeat protein